MPALLDIRSLLRSRREERAGDVFDMARRLSRNESVDPDELLAALTAAGMDDAALADLVDMIARRAEYRAKAATLPAAEKDLASARDAINRQREALDEAEKRYRRAVEPLIAQEDAAQARVSEATSAAAALSNPHNLPAVLVARMEETRDALHKANDDVRDVQELISRQSRRVEDALAVLDADGGFDRNNAQYENPERRPFMNAATLAAVENVRGGRHQIADANKRLAEVVAARDVAQAAHQAAQKAARDF